MATTIFGLKALCANHMHLIEITNKLLRMCDNFYTAKNIDYSYNMLQTYSLDTIIKCLEDLHERIVNDYTAVPHTNIIPDTDKLLFWVVREYGYIELNLFAMLDIYRGLDYKADAIIEIALCDADVKKALKQRTRYTNSLDDIITQLCTDCSSEGNIKNFNRVQSVGFILKKLALRQYEIQKAVVKLRYYAQLALSVRQQPSIPVQTYYNRGT